MIFKFLKQGRVSPFMEWCYPPVGKWTLPRTPILCRSGYHVSTEWDLASFVDRELYLVEGGGASDGNKYKKVYETIRLVRRIPFDIEAILEDWDDELVMPQYILSRGANKEEIHRAIVMQIQDHVESLVLPT